MKNKTSPFDNYPALPQANKPRASAASILFAVLFLAGLTIKSSAQQPANDNFENRIAFELTSLTNLVTGFNFGATKEEEEPNHSANPGGKSIWWTWTAPEKLTVTLDPNESTFDTLVAVYTGDSIAALNTVFLQTSEAGRGEPESFTFSALPGVTYHIAIDGSDGASGAVLLNVSAVVPPANDMFAERILVTGMTNSFSGTLLGATIEVGEPTDGARTPPPSVWWTWTAPTNWHVTLDMEDSSFDPGISVYIGESISNLTEIAKVGGSRSGNTIASFLAVEGTDYHIAITGGTIVRGESSRNFELNLFQSPPPANDSFANRISIPDLINPVLASNSFATAETGEPLHAGYSGGKSLWWSWVAPEEGSVIVNTIGSFPSILLAVYTGNDISTLTPVAGTYGGAATFMAVAGTEYQIAVDGYNGFTGDIVLNLTTKPIPRTLRVMDIAPTGVSIQLADNPGQTWTVQRAESLPGTWTTLGDVYIGVDGTALYQDASPSSPNGNFYRALLKTTGGGR